MKKIISIIIIIFLCSACSNIDYTKYLNMQSINLQSNNTKQGTSVLKKNNLIYFYNNSSLAEDKFGLFEYNIENGTITEIATASIFNYLYCIDGLLYYSLYDWNNSYEENSIKIYSYDGKNTTFEGNIADDFIKSTDPILYIFKYKEDIYVNYNNKLYKQQNKNFKEIDNNCTVDCYKDKLYYARRDDGIYDKSNNVIISRKQMLDISYIKHILGGVYDISQIQINDQYIFFLISYQNGGMGKIFRYSFDSDKIESVGDENATTSFILKENDIYYYDFNTKKIICRNEDLIETVVENIPQRIYSYDVISKYIIYSIAEGKQLQYYIYNICNGSTKSVF